MKKILALLLITLSFGLLQTNAGESKIELVEKAGYAVKTAPDIVPVKYDYNKTYKLESEITKLVDNYYHAIVFKKWNEQEFYSKASKKFKEYKKMSEWRYWHNKLEFSHFINNPKNQRILNELGYHRKYVNRYSNNSNDNTFFVKNYDIDLKDIKLNDKVEWLYLWMKVNTYNQDKYFQKVQKWGLNIKKLASVYTKHNHKEVKFKKIDLETFDWKIKIDISKIIKEFKKWNEYNVAFNFYFKVDDNYVSLLTYSINSNFNFSEYSIQRSFEQKYRKETNPTNNYYYRDRWNSINEKMEEKLNEKLSSIFKKIEAWKTKSEYINFLKLVKSKVIAFTNNRTKYNELYTIVKDQKSYNSAYSKYIKIKDKEKVVNLLLLFITNEIYENELEWTIKDFIK